MNTVAEFFAGIGLARMGLERAGFRVVWANDNDPAKREMYAGHFRDDGPGHFALGDVGDVFGDDVPRGLTLAWASFPCKDLSLAGGRGGLHSGQSMAFWGFTRVMRELGAARPPLAVLENVPGFATSHGGDDMRAVIREMNGLGYAVDVVALDARRFVPQSRPRLFLVCSPPGVVRSQALEPNPELRPDALQWVFRDAGLVTCRRPLPPPPPLLRSGLSEVVEDVPAGDPAWWDDRRAKEFLGSLSPAQADRLASLTVEAARPAYRTAYRRTRGGVPMWEIRPDDIAGCLRTPGGGSSKQALVRLAAGEPVRVRWMTPPEYARLMGAGDYHLGTMRPNQVRFGFGDAVCVPAVAWLAENYLAPLASGLDTWPRIREYLAS